MIVLNNNIVACDHNEINNNIPRINFNINTKYPHTNKALFVDFKNDFSYSIACIKKLIQFEKENKTFSSKYENYDIKYIIANYNSDIVNALKAICINDLQEQYTFIYNCVFESLDKIWKANNSCKFCNNNCIATRKKQYINQEDGCCYSFEYSKKFFSTSFIDNKQKCKYLQEDKSCSTQNLSCKLFVCDYLKKHENFKLNIKDYLLIQSFFTKKQQLILKYNFFHSKEEIINKLLENNHTPYILYYFNSNYHISR